MVAKINRGVSLYGAITYNQQKVNDTTARIIAGNRMITDVAGNPDRVMRRPFGRLTTTSSPTRTRKSPSCIFP